MLQPPLCVLTDLMTLKKIVDITFESTKKFFLFFFLFRSTSSLTLMTYTLLGFLTFYLLLPCRLYSLSCPPKVAAQENPDSRHNTGVSINITPAEVIMIGLISWSRA